MSARRQSSGSQPRPGRSSAGAGLRRLQAFAPYLALSILHLVIQQTGPGWAVTLTKALLMPALAVAVVLSVRPLRGARPTLLVAAIGLSWVGDVALSFPGDGWFVVGLTGFLLGHVAYLALFFRMARQTLAPTPAGIPRARRVPPVWTLVYLLWYIVFLSLLGPHAGALLVPVALYGAVLGSMAAASAMRGLLVAAGGALFVVSDSVLGMGRFLPHYALAGTPWHDLIVMTTYLAAQGLIAVGVVRALSPAAPPTEPGRPARATAR